MFMTSRVDGKSRTTVTGIIEHQVLLIRVGLDIEKHSCLKTSGGLSVAVTTRI